MTEGQDATRNEPYAWLNISHRSAAKKRLVGSVQPIEQTTIREIALLKRLGRRKSQMGLGRVRQESRKHATGKTAERSAAGPLPGWPWKKLEKVP